MSVLALGLMLVLAAPPAARERAAVIVIGDDAPDAGALGREIEAALAGESAFEVLPASRIAAAVSKNAPPEALAEDIAQRSRIAAAFGAVEKAYGEGKTEDALARLAEISGLLDGATAPHAADRVRLDLWRAVIFLLEDRPDAAKTWAADALIAAPDLQVDRKVFPPDVDALVGKLRTTRTPAAKITLSGAPATAFISVDDRRVSGPSFEVPRGKHVLVVSAAGFRTVATRLDVSADTSLALPLPLQIAEKEAASAFLEGAEPGALGDLATRTGADLIVVADAGTRALRARVLRKRVGGTALRIEQPFPAGAKPLLAKLRQSWAPLVMAETIRSHHLRLDAFAGLSLRQHSLSGGGTIASGFAGTALGLDAEYSLGRVALLGGASWTTWDLSPVSITRADGSTAKGGGGSTLAASLGASYPLVARPGGGLDVLGRIFAEQHTATDIGGLALFSSHQWVGASLGVRGRTALRRSGARVVWLAGSLEASPLSRWSETPAGSSGTAPAVGVVPFARFVLESDDARRGWVAGLRASRASIGFQGAARAPTSPLLSDATETESELLFFASWRRRF